MAVEKTTDVISRLDEVTARLDEVTARLGALETKISGGGVRVPDDVAKHFRKVDFVFDTYFGNEVIRFNEKDAADQAAAAVSVTG